jgi:hypothetical protein
MLFPCLQDIRVAEKVLTYCEPARDPDFPVFVKVFHGESGTGKSLKAVTEAYDKYGRDDVYIKKDGTKWWDGYDAHKCVILDDFRASWWCLTYMLSLMDRYPFRVEYKGGYRQMRAVAVYITCILHPDSWYSHASGEPLRQILRRIDVVERIEDTDTARIQEEWAEFVDREKQEQAPPAAEENGASEDVPIDE